MNTTRIALAASLLPLALAACSGTSPDVPDTGSGDVACTQEAKLCPDGSYVGRQGPNCEFTACPVTSSTTQRIATDGALSIVYSSAFSLAHKPEEISKQSYIPPCEQGFVFCLYYTGKDYDGTNFDGAGLGVVKRSDIDTESECLDTPPEGYTDVTPISRRETEYSVSAFRGSETRRRDITRTMSSIVSTRRARATSSLAASDSRSTATTRKARSKSLRPIRKRRCARNCEH